MKDLGEGFARHVQRVLGNLGQHVLHVPRISGQIDQVDMWGTSAFPN